MKDAEEKKVEEKKEFKLEAGPGKDEQTLVLDVDLPYGLLNGSHEISIPLKLGKNASGETFILGVAESISGIAESVKNALNLPSQPVQASNIPVIVKEEQSSPAVSEIKQEEKEPEQTSVSGEPLNATWLADVTFPDDSFVAPATEFNKIWRIQNSGRLSWPEGTQLVCISGFGKTAGAVTASYDVAQAASGEQVLVTARDIVAPEIAGKHTSYYRFVTPDG